MKKLILGLSGLLLSLAVAAKPLYHIESMVPLEVADELFTEHPADFTGIWTGECAALPTVLTLKIKQTKKRFFMSFISDDEKGRYEEKISFHINKFHTEDTVAPGSMKHSVRFASPRSANRMHLKAVDFSLSAPPGKNQFNIADTEEMDLNLVIEGNKLRIYDLKESKSSPICVFEKKQN